MSKESPYIGIELTAQQGRAFAALLRDADQPVCLFTINKQPCVEFQLSGDEFIWVADSECFEATAIGSYEPEVRP